MLSRRQSSVTQRVIDTNHALYEIVADQDQALVTSWGPLTDFRADSSPSDGLDLFALGDTFGYPSRHLKSSFGRELSIRSSSPGATEGWPDALSPIRLRARLPSGRFQASFTPPCGQRQTATTTVQN